MLSSATKNAQNSQIDQSYRSEEQSGPKSEVKQLEVKPEFAGQRLDNFLINLLKGLPKTRIYRIIRKGEVRVNRGRIKPDYRVQAGDIIRIPPMRLSVEPLIGSSDLNSSGKSTRVAPSLGRSGLSKLGLGRGKLGSSLSAKIEEQLLSNILFEDEGLIIVNKPSGMAVHGGSGLSYGVIEALRILRQDVENLELVHRLDRETSGCLMIAKRRSTLKWLHELLRTGQIEKRYWALVKGEWKGGLVVDQPLLKNQLSSGERIVKARAGEGSKSAITSFKVLERYGNKLQYGKEGGTNMPKSTLMEASPITGRTHQIRVHAEYAGSPVAGDEKYGDDAFNRELKKLGLSRLFLHAVSLSIPGLTTVEAPLDKMLSRVLSQLSGAGES